MKKLSILFSALLVSAMSFAGTKTVILDGDATELTSTATTAESTISQNGFSYTMSKGGKQQGASGDNKFEETKNCILIGKKDAYIYNNTAFEEKITKFELYSNKGASAKVSVSISFSNTPIKEATTNKDSLWTATLSTLDKIYEVTVPEGAKYFCYTVTNNNNSQVAFRITYEEPEGTISTPTFTPSESDFAGTTTVSLEAEEGLEIYYTLNDTVPTTASTKYTAPISLDKTTTVKAIAYNATTKKSSAVAEKTYTCYNLITECGGLANAANKDFVALGKVTVIYVNGANMYICDKTGYGLLYKYSYGLKAGQEVEGIEGRISIYSGLTEIIPSVDTAELTITEGTVPEPIKITAAPTAADLNKYVRIEGVLTPDSTWSSADKTTDARTLEVAWGADSLTLYNTFKIDQSFAAGKYNIVGFVTCYNTTIQIAVVSATAVYAVVADVNDEAFGTVTGAGEYEEGSKVTLTATANEGYKFVKWTDAEDKEVSKEATYTFTISEDTALTANFEKLPDGIENTEAAKTATKTLENGVLVITRDGIRYNAQGVVME